jgi:hypothetical protein
LRVIRKASIESNSKKNSIIEKSQEKKRITKCLEKFTKTMEKILKKNFSSDEEEDVNE